MLKIPTFVLGGLLILTGLAGYLLQDPGLSIKLTGPLAGNAKLTLSDGNETHEIDLGYASGDQTPGEHAYWLISRLNTTHAKVASQGNYAVDQGSKRYKKKSFWYGSSMGETFDALMQDAENHKNASKSKYKPVPIELSKVDKDSSTIKFVYKNETGNSGPATLQVSNWKNIDIEPKPKPNAKLEFKKSWTALIPGIIGIVLILLVLLADAKPSARKHVMHGAVLFGLLGFIMVAKRIMPAVSEMNWLKGQPNAIIQTSVLKPAAMVISAGLLLIFVILCVVSFIQARKDMAAQAKKEALAKKKRPKDKPEDKVEEKTVTTTSTKTTSKTTTSSTKVISKESSSERGSKEGEEKKSTADSEKKKDSQKAYEASKGKSEDEKSDDSDERKDSVEQSDKDAPSSAREEPEETQEKDEDDSGTETKKESGEDAGSSKEESEDEKGGDSDERKDSDEQSDKDAPSPAMKEPEESPEKKEDDSDTVEKKDSEEDTGFSYQKPDFEKSDDSDQRKDSDEQSDKDDSPSSVREESEESSEKKDDDSDTLEKEESGEPKDSSNDRPEEK